MLNQLIRKHKKLIDDLINVFGETSVDDLVNYFNSTSNTESLSSSQIQGSTAREFFHHVIQQQKFKYYDPDLLLEFVNASDSEDAIKTVTAYITLCHNTLVKDMNLICERERVEKEKLLPLGNKKILQIKSEVKPLSAEVESLIRYTACIELGFPPDSVSFLGPVPGCIILIYKYKMLDSFVQQLFQNKFATKKLVRLANLKVIWLRIDDMELKIPSVKECTEVRLNNEST